MRDKLKLYGIQFGGASTMLVSAYLLCMFMQWVAGQVHNILDDPDKYRFLLFALCSPLYLCGAVMVIGTLLSLVQLSCYAIMEPWVFTKEYLTSKETDGRD